MRVAAVDHEIALVEVCKKIVDHRIDDRSGGHEEHYLAGLLKCGDERFNIVGCRDIQCTAFFYEKLTLHLIEIVSDTRESMLGHVEKKIPPHRSETDHSKLF